MTGLVEIIGWIPKEAAREIMERARSARES